jgi:Mg2+ and Co2+ transporter CorA
MRVFHINSRVSEAGELPQQLPEQGFVWASFSRREFEISTPDVQAALVRFGLQPLMDLHLTDMLNNQLPSHYDYTTQYDILVFRRLAAGQSERDPNKPGALLTQRLNSSGPPVLRRIDTSPVAFALFDRFLITVHPADCSVRESFAARLLNVGSSAIQEVATLDSRGVSRLPSSAADLMMRLVNTMVDGYLELRRELTKQLDHWQAELLDPSTRFTNWKSLLDARSALHSLDDICEDQRGAVQEWIDTLEEWPEPETPAARRERDALKVRSRDVLEHIERVVHHVRRLEATAESAVQMHFSAVANRTNTTMRTLTALTAIFLPLNLITGIFGMNFERMPFLKESWGFAFAISSMLLVALLIVLVFMQKRYLRSRG